MGRSVERVSLDFAFPIDGEYGDYLLEQHVVVCTDENAPEDHFGCDFSLDPPEGPGWQLWQTISHGPISSVFRSDRELIDWMCQPDPKGKRPTPWAQGYTRAEAEALVRAGYADSLITSVEAGRATVRTGVQELAMKSKIAVVLAAVSMGLLPGSARAAECTAPSVCMPKEDVTAFVELLREKKCLQTDKPTFTTDPINIVIDQDGRVFGSGSNPVPWTIHMKWCSYDVTAAGQVKISVAMREPPTWGFRFRPKAFVGLLGVEAFARDRLVDAVDVGVLVEPFYYRSFNINGAVGMRSAGAGIGFDVTRNVSLYLGYAMTYVERRSNPFLGISFALW